MLKDSPQCNYLEVKLLNNKTMKKKKIIHGEVVTLVTIPKFMPVIMWPGIGEYDNPYILRVQPCIKAKEKYFDLATGNPVVRKENMKEWKNLTGTVFCYPDNECLLISRMYEGNKLMLFSISPDEITPTMIKREVFNRVRD